MAQTSQPPCSQGVLWELFEYTEGGRLLRKSSGELADHDTKEDYRRVYVDGRRHYAHRVIYFMHTGVWSSSKLPIDHIDGDSKNNRIENLQVLSNSNNIRKGKMRKNNTSGYKGVVWHKGAGKWCVTIRQNRRHVYLGLYEDVELAGLVAEEARDLIAKGQALEGRYGT